MTDISMHWFPFGAQASDPVRCILVRAGLLPIPPLVVTGMHSGSCGGVISRRKHKLGRNLIAESMTHGLAESRIPFSLQT
ncbi:hypothetical protein SADUNF_Sadunf13G0100900 [Salix dunnii]|uniref:Uncharacterized protein n=1 Tax=Salix dunnii TaxID=1413687 RepID=A0A835ML91_9ROSI|nr:hypothetical protein SADUNF_Sadunf13G0100900 [Salix dunnii]